MLIVTACGNNEESEDYIRWGDSIHTIDIERLEINDIPYKVENNIVYVRSDKFDRAILCCS